MAAGETRWHGHVKRKARSDWSSGLPGPFSYLMRACAPKPSPLSSEVDGFRSSISNIEAVSSHLRSSDCEALELRFWTYEKLERYHCAASRPLRGHREGLCRNPICTCQSTTVMKLPEVIYVQNGNPLAWHGSAPAKSWLAVGNVCTLSIVPG